MKKLFSVLKYTKNYKGYLTANVSFNILFAVFSAVSLTLAVPFLKLLFEETNLLETGLILLNGKPKFAFSSEYVKDISNYYLAGLIITQGGKAKALVVICVIVFSMTFFKNIFRYLAMYFIAPIRNGVVRDLRNKIYKKAMNLPLSYYSEEKKGDLMSRMTSDVQEIEWSIMQTLEMIFREPLTIIISFSLMLLISAKLTLYILILLPIAALFIVILGKSLKNASRKSKETLGGLISVIEETLGSLKVIKAFSAMSPMQKKFEEINQRYYKQSVKVYRKTDLSSPLTEIIVTGILMFILFIGGSMVFNGELTGPLFMGYFILASQLIPPIKQLSTAYSNIQKGVASEERIDKILLADNLIVDKADAKELHEFSKEIEYKNLSFAYHKGDEGYVLKDINLKIAKGKTIALVGQSGSGKTTMADMLPRFYESDKGELLIDGVNIKNLQTESVRKQIGVVTQESVLFNDTVKNNIIFGMQNISANEVIEAAKIANAHEFIMQLPNGYDTIIGDRGGKLSGGQRQRLSIARAILKNPAILILDEATSALDTESEKLVQEALTNLMKNRTSLVIAHRLSTIANADEIIVMSKGEIIERGNHEQLLALNGTYKKLCDMQSFK
ncbi:MAG: ABC transporter ATP-binding protein [Bacteroidota bacterium]|nr:ABC transporter ATP-binding protein [Bacteroidota bacterium]MDP3146201.1 ABC transporter ATP-binding protein [Bacteroidota bacterium]